MPQANVIHWREGHGWLVLSGGGDFHSADVGEIEAEALARVRSGDPVAYVWAAGDIETADSHLAALDDLGAPTGYLVDILTEDDDTLREQLSVAGLIVLGDGPNVGTLRSALPGGALDGITHAFEDGAVILGVGQSAAILGSILTGQDGLGWVEDAIIVPSYEENNQIEQLHDLLAKHPNAYGLGIATGSALALGPDGKIEAWGKGQVTVTLGHNFT
ncbi:MAG: Type 1 glutamine amidotransferase-like domain-containing protein [Chloroflexota bacterium]